MASKKIPKKNLTTSSLEISHNISGGFRFSINLLPEKGHSIGDVSQGFVQEIGEEIKELILNYIDEKQIAKSIIKKVEHLSLDTSYEKRFYQTINGKMVRDISDKITHTSYTQGTTDER
jgi:hypothetical protein